MDNEKYDSKVYNKTIYSFKPNELAKLMPWDTQVQLGAVAERVLAGLLRSECLKRVGIKQSPDVNVEYDMVKEQFTVYVPRVWCSACKNRRAEFEYNNQPFCKECAQTLKQQLESKKEEPKTEKKTRKKK
jgi:hypothetical protein